MGTVTGWCAKIKSSDPEGRGMTEEEVNHGTKFPEHQRP